MSQPSNQPAPRYVVCDCQHCDGHIEFDANEFAEENSIVPCPHCGLETKLFITQKVAAPAGPDSPAVRREGFFCGNTDFEAKAPSSMLPLAQKVEISQGTNEAINSIRDAQEQSHQKDSSPESGDLLHVGGVQPFCPALERNLKRFPKRTRLVLTVEQCNSPIGQELLSLLNVILRDGLVAEEEARRLQDWVNQNHNPQIAAIELLSHSLKGISQNKKISENKLMEIQCTIERILPKDIRGGVIEKRQIAQDNQPADKRMVKIIRAQGGAVWPGIKRKEAYELKEALFRKPSPKQLKYIEDLGGNPWPEMTREDASVMIDELLHCTRATDKQFEYIRALGGNPPADLTRAGAEEIIPHLQQEQYKLTATQLTPSPRQIMVLRFWNRMDLMQTSKWEVEQWLDRFYLETPVEGRHGKRSS